jgi:hypothetical protein
MPNNEEQPSAKETSKSEAQKELPNKMPQHRVNKFGAKHHRI